HLAGTDVEFRKLLLDGVAYRICQRFLESEHSLAKAEEVATASQPHLLAAALTAKGNLAVDQKKYTEASDFFGKALALSRKWADRDQEANVPVCLARVATSVRHFDEAIDASRPALDISTSLDLPNLVSTTEGNLGWSYFELGDYYQALE